MNDPKREQPNVGPVQAAAGAANRAEKVRSSRYEWEGQTHENEKSSGASSASRRSLLASARAWLKKFFFAGRGLFDNDDDASPSAA
jgi:hypothetical protein